MTQEKWGNLPQAVVVAAIPSDRYWLAEGESAVPDTGDVVVVDQGAQSADGLPMVVVYALDDSGTPVYEALVYESELEQTHEGSDPDSDPDSDPA